MLALSSFVWRFVSIFDSFLSRTKCFHISSPAMTPDELQEARLINELDDDEAIDSADDEEVDSEAAFDESDEDRFAGFFSSKV